VKIVTINKDINASPALYRGYTKDGMLLVTSIFKTIQGEGPYAGEPCVFLRLAGCNIGEKTDCEWCDTRFTFSEGKVISIDDVARTIHEIMGNARLVVVTGGEPLLQWSAMFDLIRSMGRYRWQFETNGLLLKSDVIDAAKPHDITFVVSPKVPATWQVYRAVPNYWAAGNVQLKYVVDVDPTSRYHQPGPTGGLTTYLSGMAVYKRAVRRDEVSNIWDRTLIDQEATALNYRHAANLVLHGPDHYRLSLQTHLFAGVE